MSGPLRVLVPTDGCDPTQRATRHLLDLAARGLKALADSLRWPKPPALNRMRTPVSVTRAR